TTVVGGAAGTTTSTTQPTTTLPRAKSVATSALYGPSKDDQLTLITSGSKAPWNRSTATVVVAKLLGTPFKFTPQGALSDGAMGNDGDTSAWPAAMLAVIAFGAVIAGSVAMYRRTTFRVAYALTIAPLVVLTIITGETLARLLPAWT